jgi:hypothetical protein
LPTGYRRIDEVKTRITSYFAKLTRHFGRSCGVINKHSARCHARESTVFTQANFPQITIGADAAEDHQTAFSSLARARCCLSTVLVSPLSGPGGIPIEYGDLMTGFR